MQNKDNRTEAEQGSNQNPPSSSDSIDSQNSEPSIPDWMFKVVEVQTKQATVHHKPTDEEQSKAEILADRVKKSDRWMIGLTGIIAFATVVNVAIYFDDSRTNNAQIRKLLEIANKQSTAAIKQVEKLEAGVNETSRLATAAGEANDIARDANKQSRENAILSERPWIGLSTANVSGMKIGERPTIAFRIVNFGKTPGVKVQMVTGFAVEPPSTTVKTLIKFINSLQLKEIGTMYPGQPIGNDAAWPVNLNNATMGAINNGAVTFLGLGKIIYYNTRDGRKHQTWIYSFFDPKLKTMVRLHPLNWPIDE